MEILDILILGSGPAALCLASELANQDLNIKGISTKSPNEKWENTYGIWASELEELGLESLLSHRWCQTVSFFGDGENKKGDTPTKHNYDYGLINQEAFQNELLKKCKGIEWFNETAKEIKEKNKLSEVTCFSGLKIKARLVIDASGHKSNFVKRPVQNEIAHETFFVEETSLASYPALSQENLKKRLYKRLNSKGIEVSEIFHEENCLFPMNLPLPFKKQFVLGFGGAASMVHPASGYMVGSLLRRAPLLAQKLAIFLKEPQLSSLELASKGWEILWPYELTQRHKLYQYGLRRLMSFDESRLRSFFSNFFRLSTNEWVGFLTNTLPLPKLIYVMSKMFINSPLKVKLGMLKLN